MASQVLKDHPCPHLGGPTTLGFYVTMTILEKCWIKLDATLVELMEGKDYGELERARLKGVCRGQAEVIAEFMGKFFPDADAVAAEAKRRYEARVRGESYETIGLGHLKYAGPPDHTNPGRMPTEKRLPPPASRQTNPLEKFKPEEIKAIKAATEMGMMNKAELAKMYKVSEDIIQAAIDS